MQCVYALGSASRTQGLRFGCRGGESGQLGDGTTVDQRTVPAPVTGAHTKFTMVASGNEHTCGVLAGSKQVACWGAWGCVGSAVPSLGGLSPGLPHAQRVCAPCHRLISEITKYAPHAALPYPGAGSYSQLGTGDDSDAAQPTLISDGGASTYTSVGCGSQHSCALCTDGMALCWGENSAGQAGQPGGQSVQVPTIVKGPKFRQLAVGGHHTCGLRASDNRAMCWGG